MDDERKGNTGGNSCGSEEGRELAEHLEALDRLASEDAIQTVLASQLEIHFSNCCFMGLIVDTG